LNTEQTTPSTGTLTVKHGMADMLKGGVIMDVVTPEQAKIAEDAGAVAVMALERVPADIRAQGGVGGGIIGAVPGQLGVATFSPRLDGHGNSVRGVELFEQFSDDMGMHVMNVPTVARSALRADNQHGSGGGA